VTGQSNPLIQLPGSQLLGALCQFFNRAKNATRDGAAQKKSSCQSNDDEGNPTALRQRLDLLRFGERCAHVAFRRVREGGQVLIEAVLGGRQIVLAQRRRLFPLSRGREREDLLRRIV